MPVRSQAEIADLVRDPQQRFGLTQIELAQEPGVSHQSVNSWENGRNMPLPIAASLACPLGLAGRIYWKSILWSSDLQF